MGVALASLWLAFAAVPCGALETIGLDLGHQHAAAESAAADHDCPHCPPAQPATATPGDCIGLDDALLAKLGASDLVIAAAPTPPALAPVEAGAPMRAPRATDRDRPHTVPLNLRYCTFLE